MTSKGRIFSGMRPTGRLHLGNYLGALQNWVALQNEGYECIYCVVDLHALTTETDTSHLRANTYEMVLDWLAAGLDPQKTILFVQSQVPEVNELHVILSMVTPFGRLEDLPTFKEKVRQNPENVNYGLLGYPVLQAADITLYLAQYVPVGEDQVPHIEFTREVVRRFNNRWGEVLVEPEAKLTETPRVMGLDSVNKMSKSLDNHIELAATPEEIRRRVMTMVTDPQRTHRHIPGRPEVCNVYHLHQIYTPADQVIRIEHDCKTAAIGCVDCKKIFAASLITGLAEHRERRARFAADPDYVWDVLAEGRKRASVIAQDVMLRVRDAVGLP
ncbi:MAG: tryptophan--tRNA ligase [Chloroflexi bacterium]|nr:tryptophan--tRNA ligase [Chloroflexota bacterium]